MRIGIDVGGTNTDAVIMDGDRVLAEVKTATTADVTSGIVNAVNALVSQSGVSAGQIQAVMIGTTHFTNAFVEGRHLAPTAAVRLGLPATRSLPPMVDWPERLRAAIKCRTYLCRGGNEFDGRRIAELDRDELLRAAEDIARNELRSIAISAVFSPVNPEFELQAAELFAAELPEIPVTLSHELGRIGLLERENAAIMNASLRGLASRIVHAFNAALDEFGIAAPIYLSQNDGTLMTVDFAERYPVTTFASGPTNSMRGAALLSGLDDCAVVDIGGTTSDIGVLQHGFPREASIAVRVGGVRTNFRMPDVLSLGIGGGSLVRTEPEIAVGPESVGFELTTRALVFGGETLTASDLAVAAGRASFGDESRVRAVGRQTAQKALAWVEQQIAEAVDRMKTSPDPIPVVLVGGGSVLLEDTLEGASEVVRPDHFGVANAIGAAIAQVGGEVERVFALEERSRDEAVEEAKGEAIEKAIAAGAVRSTVRIVDVEEVALAYLPGNATRIKVKAVGELGLGDDIAGSD